MINRIISWIFLLLGSFLCFVSGYAIIGGIKFEQYFVAFTGVVWFLCALGCFYAYRIYTPKATYPNPKVFKLQKTKKEVENGN